VAYATPQQLADAMRVPLTAANTPLFTECLAAAADEIDHELDGPLVSPVSELVIRTNVNRAQEWVKANDTPFGVLGMEQTGLYTPKDGFSRHAANLLPLKGAGWDPTLGTLGPWGVA
jgi:hypothetical protein